MRSGGSIISGMDVADLARAERFYTEVLGMTVVRRLPDQVLLSATTATARSSSSRTARPAGSSRSPSRWARAITPSRSRGTTTAPRRRCSPAATSRTTPSIDWGDHECLYFLDPDGNLLELIGYRSR